MKEFIETKSLVMEIQNFVVNSNSKEYQFLSTFPAKINDKIFKINKKTRPFLWPY